MAEQIRRVFVEKKAGFNVKAAELLADFRTNLGLENLINLRLFNRYDIAGINETAFEQACTTILAEPPVDLVYQEKLKIASNESVFAVEYLPGQYDQRADSAEQCLQIINNDQRPQIRVAQVFLLQGKLNPAELEKIKSYYINPVDSREASLAKPDSLEIKYQLPEQVAIIADFITADQTALNRILTEFGLAMSLADLEHTQKYFKSIEKRNPTLTEIRVLDTYWSDHCRHTTFLTKITDVEIEQSKFTTAVETAYQEYLAARHELYPDQDKDICLMDLALIGMKELRTAGKLNDLEISNEVNAASIEITVDVDGKNEDWLLMFKNETHNHPTEIEPFGGAATCLGGAIRDPLSGRSYVYQAMRVTGAADPRQPLGKTIPGKLPQKKIVQQAAAGYSSYGNQIGLATGHVAEIYHTGFLAKHMEIGAVLAAVPAENVVRGAAEPGDLVILLGGKTGRDGCGGATGSSKIHTEDSIEESGAEVQKGNPPTERKIQRLFRNPAVSKKIKVCNDFGAGGVAVAIGELAPALEIDLNAVPKKYAGLDGTELAISESQERMAVVIDPADKNEFIRLAAAENLEATVVAEVKSDQRLVMNWNGQKVVDLSRDFLATNGATQKAAVKIEAPADSSYFATAAVEFKDDNFKNNWLQLMSDLNIASQKGLIEKFDSTIGAGTILMPFGGKHQLTPAQVMAAKIPLLKGDTKTGTLMSYGYDPDLSSWSPFHGAYYAVVDSIAKLVAAGGDYNKIRFSFQEYFERLFKEPARWGKSFSALLGAYAAQKDFSLPAIGGKDSMSGTFEELNVPPTLVSFAVTTVNVQDVISPELKAVANQLIYLPAVRERDDLPDINKLKVLYQKVKSGITAGQIKAVYAVGRGGIAEALAKMCFGNQLGAEIDANLEDLNIFTADYGSLLVEVSPETDLTKLFGQTEYCLLGKTSSEAVINWQGNKVALAELLKAWQQPLEKIYPTQAKTGSGSNKIEKSNITNFGKVEQNYNNKFPGLQISKPRVILPVFPGTNCEYDTARQFEEAGAEVDTFVFKNLNPAVLAASIKELAERIKQAQLLMLAGGFSAGDEPDGSGKFIASVFRNPLLKTAVAGLIQKRAGLVLGICNGFQVLIKLGLLPYGEIRELSPADPTLTYNTIGRHVSQMVQTKIVSTKSPWLARVNEGEIYTIPVSHGEGRFAARTEQLKRLASQGQIATQYVDLTGQPTLEFPFNPNGSAAAVEGLTDPTGRILGKMGHSERIGNNLTKNINGLKDQQLFQAGVEYFKNN